MIANLLRKHKLIVGAVLAAMFVTVYTSCNITNPINNIALVFNTLSLSTTASVNFVDAATGQSIGSSSQQIKVNLSFTGPSANEIVTTLDEPITSASTQSGGLEFGVSSSVMPTSQGPVKVTLVASSAGYQTTSYPVTISSTGSHSITIAMVKTSAPPQGASTAPPTPIQTNSSGQTNTTTTVQTSSGSPAGGSAGITVASGTTIRDANGNPLTGTLTANVTYFSNNQSANGALPTGLSVTATNQDGSTGQGYIQAASFASFTITNQSGQLAKTFSPPITLSFTVPGSTVNPNTNAQITNGDTIPVYSYDENSQTWKFETNGTAAGPDANGGFTVTFQASHLSDWLTGWILSGAQTCTNNFTLNINGGYSDLLLKAEIDGSTILTQRVTGDQSSYPLGLLTVPKGVPVTIETYSELECPAALVGSVTIPDLCATNTINLNVSQSGYTDVNVDVTAFCPHLDPPLQVKPDGYSIYVIRSCTGETVNVGTLTKGQITLHGIKMGDTYTFAMYYKNTLYTQEHTVDSTNYTFNYDIIDSVCNADFK